MRNALGKPPRVDEHERVAIRTDQIGHTVVDLGPHLVGRHGAQLVFGHLDRKLHRAAVPDVDDARPLAQELGDLFDGLDGCRESDALRLRPLDQRIEPRQRQR